jgi:hypothetical protein
MVRTFAVGSSSRAKALRAGTRTISGSAFSALSAKQSSHSMQGRAAVKPSMGKIFVTPPVSIDESDSEVVTAGWKLAWLEAVAGDPEMTGLTVKVATAISSRADKRGIARTASQVWIAKRVSATEQGVRDCIRRLCGRGHLEIAATGYRAASGRGYVTEYRLVRRSASATVNPQNPQARLASSATPENPQAPHQKPSSALEALPSIFQRHFQERRKRSGSPDGNSKPSNPWQAIKYELKQSKSVSQDDITSWLDKLQLHSIKDGVLKLMAPGGHSADHVRKNFHDQILQAWRQIEPNGKVLIEASPSPTGATAARAPHRSPAPSSRPIDQGVQDWRVRRDLSRAALAELRAYNEANRENRQGTSQVATDWKSRRDAQHRAHADLKASIARDEGGADDGGEGD